VSENTGHDDSAGVVTLRVDGPPEAAGIIDDLLPAAR
jgi:hypothetical protein